MAQSVVTTIDNPWNPFRDFDKWLAWDNHYHYDTTRWLASLVFTSSKLSDEQYSEDIVEAQNELVRLNPFGLHVKIYDYEADELIPILNQVYREHEDELAVD